MHILLVDDHALFRDGLTLLVQQLEAGSTVHALESASQAEAFVRDDPDLDLVLLDYNLPDSNGLDLLKLIRAALPATPVAMLSAEESPTLIQSALQSGASGFITKTSSSDVMISAVKLILNGGVYVPPAILKGGVPTPPVATPAAPATTHTPPPIGAERNAPRQFQLTERQRDVLREMVKGLSNKEIARELNMSPSTVKVHVAAILREMDAKNRTQVVTLAQDMDI